MMDSHSDYRPEIVLDSFPKRMIGGNILIRVFPEEYLKVGSIILGDMESINTEKHRFNPANHAIRRGRVELCNEGAVADCDMFKSVVDVKIGDYVWFDYLTGINSILLRYKNNYYYILNYTDLICRKRNDTIYPLNGYVLCDLVKWKHPYLGHEEIDRQKAVVRYVGQNVEYKYRSTCNVNVNDTVITYSPIYMLEDDTHLLLDGNKYRVLKRSQLEAIYEEI